MSPPPDAGGAEESTVRWRLRLAYDGAGFRGFAAQEGQPTVAGALAAALGRLVGSPPALTCAGRTDAGVHALDQWVHFDVPAGVAARLDPAGVVRSCNSQLAPTIVVREAGPAPRGFDARRSARSRRYRYLVLNAPVTDPLLAGVAWHVSDPLDLRAMMAAADALLGEHDFRAFCRRVPGTTPADPIPRRVTEARWTLVAGRGLPTGGRTGPPTLPVGVGPAVGSLLCFEIAANAFCHQMVRSLVGTLVDVGRGRRRAADVPWLIASADRNLAAQPAPPHGLALVAVEYPD